MAQLTVGIPVFNGMPYLPEAIESLLSQTYSDFEILIVDDGSTDAGPEYLRSIKDKRIRILRQPNQGLTATLNRILAEAHTPWLVRQDADDISYPERLKKIAEYTERYPEAAMFYSLADYHPREKTVGNFRTTEASPDELREITRSGYLISLCHPTVTLNVAQAIAAGGYRFNTHVEDLDLWWRIALTSDIRFIPETLVGYRQHATSVSQRNFEVQHLGTMYVQYLLISHLKGLRPLPYDDAVRQLSTLVDEKHLRFRGYLREANFCFVSNQKIKAIANLTLAFATSPSRFVRRALAEKITKRKIAVGESPKKFESMATALWPA